MTRSRFIAVTAVFTVAIASAAVRKPSYVLRGEGNLRQFGVWFAADGARVVSVDRKNESVYLRVDRVAGGKVANEARLTIGDAMVPSVALRADTAAAYTAGLSSNDVLFYAYANKAWTQTQRLVLSKECTDPALAFTDIHLGDNIALVESRAVWCVFERTKGQWALSTTFPHETGAYAGVSGRRVLIGTRAGVDQITRDGATWKRTSIVTAAKNGIEDMSASERWLLLRDSDGNLTAYDLDAGAKLVHSVSPKDGVSAVRFMGIGERAFAYNGEYGARAWCFDKTWRDCGALQASLGTSEVNPISVGDAIWIGSPVDDPESTGTGTIYGFVAR